MLIFECIYGFLALALSIIVIRSDLTIGLIRNKTLLNFTAIIVAVDIIYFSIFARYLFLIYVINVAIVASVSVLLFYTNSFAGGDSKLAVVFALCYPANLYLSYGKSRITLVIAIGLAILGGYIYLLISSLINLLGNKRGWNFSYIKNYLIRFVKSFCIAMVYITAINVLVMLAYKNGFTPYAWAVSLVCLTVAWIVGRYPFFHKWQMVLGFFIIDILGALYLRELPISLHPSDYGLVFILLLCQMMISTNLYEEIGIDDLKKGMILSTASSMMMQASKIQGLPAISTEDLRSRLTDDEVGSIRRWAENNNVSEISILKKIPFAIFLSLGYLAYFLIWWLI